MGLAFPLGLAAAALALPLLLLYVLKLRRRRVVVASTLPWRSALLDRRASSPWERLRRHLLLLLQLLALALMTLALAGPFLRTDTTIAGDTVIVLDVSASMGAHVPGGEATRIDEARHRLVSSLASLPDGQRAALVLAGAEPRVAAPLSADRAVLARALRDARPLDAPADLAAALELARSLARGGASSAILLVTDGAFDASPALDAALDSVRIVRVGGDEPASNAGIVSLALRPVAGEAGVHEIFVGVSSLPARPEPVEVLVDAARPAVEPGGPPDPAAWTWTRAARETVVPDGAGQAAQLFRVQAEPGAVLRVQLPGGDSLVSDDRAMLVVPERPTRRILLASPRPFLLARALGALPSVDVLVTPGAPGSGEGYDAVVIDGPMPDVMPLRPTLVFGAPRVTGPEAVARLEHPRIVRWQARHPALRHARMDAVEVDSAWSGAIPPGGDVIVESDAGPLAVAWPAPGGRALAFWFDLTETDLPLRVAFPVLLADAVDWLTEGAEREGVIRTGAPRALPFDGSEAATLLAEGEPPRRLEPRAGVLQLPALERVGIVGIAPDAESTPSAPRLLAAALLSAEESDLSSRGVGSRAGSEAQAAVGGPAAREPGRRPLWPWLVALAVGVLFVEWSVHHGRRE